MNNIVFYIISFLDHRYFYFQHKPIKLLVLRNAMSYNLRCMNNGMIDHVCAWLREWRQQYYYSPVGLSRLQPKFKLLTYNEQGKVIKRECKLKTATADPQIQRHKCEVPPHQGAGHPSLKRNHVATFPSLEHVARRSGTRTRCTSWNAYDQDEKWEHSWSTPYHNRWNGNLPRVIWLFQVVSSIAWSWRLAFSVKDV